MTGNVKHVIQIYFRRIVYFILFSLSIFCIIDNNNLRLFFSLSLTVTYNPYLAKQSCYHTSCHQRSHFEKSPAYAFRLFWCVLGSLFITPLHTHNWQVEQKLGGRGREWATLGVHPLSWLLSNNRLEKVPFVSVSHASSNRLLLSNQDKGCTPSVAHSLALPLGPALLNLWINNSLCGETMQNLLET